MLWEYSSRFPLPQVEFRPPWSPTLRVRYLLRRCSSRRGPGCCDVMNGTDLAGRLETDLSGAALNATGVPFTFGNLSLLAPSVTSGWEGVTLATLQVGVLVVGVLGNVSVAASVWRRGSSQQQQLAAHRHALLLSLALADLLVTLLCLPAATTNLLSINWTAPGIFCSLLSAAQSTAHAASTLSLSLLALDRYLAVRRPKMAPKVSAVTVHLLVILWVLAVLMALPRGLMSTLRAPGPVCGEVWPSRLLRILYYTAVAMLVHLLPCGAVIVCHAAVATSLRRRGVDDTKMNLRPRQVIIMAKDCSVGGPNNHKIVAASSSGVDSANEEEGEEGERAVFDLHGAQVPQLPRDAGRGRGPQPPPRPAAAIKPARNIHTIIRAHRRMRVRGPPTAASIFTSYRGHSVETRRRLARLLMILGIVFASCWLPYIFALMLWAWWECPATQHAMQVTLVLGHAHSAINPVVYWLMNRAFLTSLHRLVSTQLRFPEGFSCGGCTRPDCLTRPPAPPWAGNSSTNEDNLGAFHPKYLNPHALRPQASRCTSHYFH